MKKLIYVFILVLLFSFKSWAASATFEWDANTEPDLAGYKIHWGEATRNYTNTVDVKNVTTFKIDNLPDGELFFAATAYDTENNESEYSNEVVVSFNTIAPGKPINFRITITEAKSVLVEVE